LARNKRQADARRLFGLVQWEGDLNQERLDELQEPERDS
jgi:hypothetical protein